MSDNKPATTMQQLLKENCVKLATWPGINPLANEEAPESDKSKATSER